MKITSVNKLTKKYTQYDITTKTENFYIKAGDKWILIHNSPSVTFGVNPDNKKFFVGTKGVFAKDAKICYSKDDIDKWYSGELAKKLLYCLTYLPEINPRGVLQGD